MRRHHNLREGRLPGNPFLSGLPAAAEEKEEKGREKDPSPTDCLILMFPVDIMWSGHISSQDFSRSASGAFWSSYGL